MGPFDVIVRVKGIRGKCSFHKVGDTIEFGHNRMEGRICPVAFNSIYYAVYAMIYGAEFPWEKDKDRRTVGCPDEKNTVTFEIERLRTR